MHIAIDTSADLSQLDRQILAVLSGAQPVTLDTAPPEPATAPTPAKPAAPKAKPAPAPKPEPVVEAEPTPEPVVEAEPEPTPEPEEDLVGAEGPTMADAVAAATKLVSSGEAKKVKEALASVGAQRVSNIEADKVAAFLAALA